MYTLGYPAKAHVKVERREKRRGEGAGVQSVFRKTDADPRMARECSRM
jgi:hypothetical protein